MRKEEKAVPLIGTLSAVIVLFVLQDDCWTYACINHLTGRPRFAARRPGLDFFLYRKLREKPDSEHRNTLEYKVLRKRERARRAGNCAKNR
ncbi:MAG: hypothetical protein Q4F18_04945, partial [Clostridia bacterium]|nr:hypothetical protein [Clostridia bacterium]